MEGIVSQLGTKKDIGIEHILFYVLILYTKALAKVICIWDNKGNNVLVIGHLARLMMISYWHLILNYP